MNELMNVWCLMHSNLIGAVSSVAGSSKSCIMCRFTVSGTNDARAVQNLLSLPDIVSNAHVQKLCPQATPPCAIRGIYNNRLQLLDKIDQHLQYIISSGVIEMNRDVDEQLHIDR